MELQTGEPSFDQAIDRVIDYLAADEEDDYECQGRPADHIWRAVQVLVRHRGQCKREEINA